MFLIDFVVCAFTGRPAESDLDERRTCFSFSGKGFRALFVVLRLALVFDGDICSGAFFRKWT